MIKIFLVLVALGLTVLNCSADNPMQPVYRSSITQMASNNMAHATRKSLAMGPSVRNLLAHYQIDPAKITSTGPHQTLLKGDVLSYISQNSLSPAQQDQQTTKASNAAKFVPNLDTSGYQPKPGPEGFSKIAKKLLDM